MNNTMWVFQILSIDISMKKWNTCQTAHKPCPKSSFWTVPVLVERVPRWYAPESNRGPVIFLAVSFLAPLVIYSSISMRAMRWPWSLTECWLIGLWMQKGRNRSDVHASILFANNHPPLPLCPFRKRWTDWGTQRVLWGDTNFGLHITFFLGIRGV